MHVPIFTRSIEFEKNVYLSCIICRAGGVVRVGAEGAMATADFGRSVNPSSTKGDKLCPHNEMAPSDFQTFLRP